MEQEEMPNIKVYKTNVAEGSQAEKILAKIRKTHPDSDPSFDLEDRDKVLRVENRDKPINDATIRSLVKKSGYHIEELF